MFIWVYMGIVQMVERGYVGLVDRGRVLKK